MLSVSGLTAWNSLHRAQLLSIHRSEDLPSSATCRVGIPPALGRRRSRSKISSRLIPEHLLQRTVGPSVGVVRAAFGGTGTGSRHALLRGCSESFIVLDSYLPTGHKRLTLLCVARSWEFVRRKSSRARSRLITRKQVDPLELVDDAFTGSNELKSRLLRRRNWRRKFNCGGKMDMAIRASTEVAALRTGHVDANFISHPSSSAQLSYHNSIAKTYWRKCSF